MKGTNIIATALAAAALAAAAPAEARDPIPRTVAEAKAQMAAAERYTASWPYYRDPPGNVRAEDYRKLFGGRVMISRKYYWKWPDRDDVKIIFIGRDGRYEWCSLYSRDGHHTYREPQAPPTLWRAEPAL